MPLEAPWEPSPDQPITAEWGRRVARAIRALLAAIPTGMGGSVAPAGSPAGSARRREGYGVLKVNALVAERQDPNDPNSTLVLKCRELYVLGRGAEVDFELPESGSVDQTIVVDVAYNETTKILSKVTRTAKVIEVSEPTTATVFEAEDCPT